MSRKERPPPSKPNMGYLVSFGDTMTALLAFFIVLNSLAKEQTGANLHAGTSSFSAAFTNLSSPGNLQTDRSDRVVSQTAPSPLYAVDDPGRKDKNTEGGIGPDDTDDGQRVIDRQQENFKRFLSEVQYQHGLKQEKSATSQIVFDSFQKLSGDSVKLDENSIRLAAQSIPMLRSQEYQMEIIVWANSPGKSSMSDAFERAAVVKTQISSMFRLSDSQKSQIRFTAKPWLFADAKRPTVSFVMAKMAGAK